MASNNEAPVDLIAGEILAPRFTINSGHISPDAVLLPDYAGVYRVGSKTAFTFVAHEQQLYGRVSGQSFNALTPAATDVFTFPEVSAEFTFHREGGKVVTSTLRQRGSELIARRVDEPSPAVAFDSKLIQAAIGGDYIVAVPALPAMRFEVRAERPVGDPPERPANAACLPDAGQSGPHVKANMAQAGAVQQAAAIERTGAPAPDGLGARIDGYASVGYQQRSFINVQNWNHRYLDRTGR